MQWHKNWKHLLKLQITDPGVQEHEIFTRDLETMVCYDQMNVSDLAAIEILARRFQVHEERYRLKLRGGPPKGQHLIAMTSRCSWGTKGIVG